MNHPARHPVTAAGLLLGLLLPPGSASPQAATTEFRLHHDGLTASAGAAGARDLDVEISTAGLALRPGPESPFTATRWSLSLTTYGVGAPGAVRDGAATTLHSDFDGVELVRDAFVERFTPTADGLRQTWTLTAPSEGSVWIGLRAKGLQPRVTEGGSAALLLDESNLARVRMHTVSATDAAGRDVPVAVQDGRYGFGLLVESDRFAHPVTVTAELGAATYVVPEPLVANAPDAAGRVSVGDLNADGYVDLAAVAAGTGTLEVFLGGPDGSPQTADWSWAPRGVAAFEGAVFGTAGDVNGDGFGDLFVGLPQQVERGLALVFHGGFAGPSHEPDFALVGPDDSSQLGRALAGVGDANGDGYDDVALSRVRHGEGVVDVLPGGPAGLGTSAFTTLDAAGTGLTGLSGFGATLAGSGAQLRVGVTTREQREETVVYALGGPLYPGTGEGLDLLAGPPGMVGPQDVQTLELGSPLTLEMYAPAAHHGGIGVLSFQGFGLGTYPGPTPGLPGLALNLFQPYVNLFVFVITPGPETWVLSLPASTNFADKSLLFQGFAFGVPAANGLFVSSEAREVRTPQTRVYVSHSVGQDGAPGTANQPVRLLGKALTLADELWSPQLGYPELYLEGGVWDEDLNSLNRPISMRGGLDAVTWNPNPANPTILSADHQGTEFRNIASPTTIANITFRSGDAAGASGVGFAKLSRAVEVRNCTAELVFLDCVFEAGRGGDGAYGTSPAGLPLAATSGEDGESANLVPYDGKSGGLGGWGTSPQLPVGHSIFGGHGGDGSAVGAGAAGMPAFDIDPFTQVLSFPCGPFGGSGGSLCCTLAAKTGSDGADGIDGSAGAGGTTALYGGFHQPDGNWTSGVGTSGVAGTAACGGTGGGGGSGFGWSTPFPPFWFQWDGGGGGGGGAGGRGGLPGTPGTNGGASFAVKLWNASPTFTLCTFAPGQGGRGGDGGLGQPGGEGGQAGSGGGDLSASFGASGAEVDVGLGGGGDGGDGGTGGHGGGGAGGHGGPSICVYRGGTSDPVSLLTSGNTFLPGTPGEPGNGGVNAADGSLGPVGVTLP